MCAPHSLRRPALSPAFSIAPLQSVRHSPEKQRFSQCLLHPYRDHSYRQLVPVRYMLNTSNSNPILLSRSS